PPDDPAVEEGGVPVVGMERASLDSARGALMCLSRFQR
ncbi:MAG: hypothetical protein ACI80K_003143, partial [Paracoccaceae bacterium]